jgi:hypothetical protein
MSRPRHAFLSSFLATCAVVLVSAVPLTLEAASSYFMVQGPLGAGGTYQTYKFRVEYSGVLTIPGYNAEETPLVNSGEALIAAVFGNGVTTESGVYSNSVGTATIPGGFLSSFQMAGGSSVAAGIWPTGPQWGAFSAGGTYVDTWADPVINGVYTPGIWTEAKTGMATRYLSDGSFDAWVYGNMSPTDFEDEWGFPIMTFAPPTGVTPTLADFSGSGYTETKVSANGLSYSVYLITAVPEPGRMLLCLLGITAVIARRSRRTRF